MTHGVFIKATAKAHPIISKQKPDSGRNCKSKRREEVDSISLRVVGQILIGWSGLLR